MKHIHQTLYERLKTVSSLRWIDVDLGQMEFYESKPAVAFPCALIDIELPNCEDWGGTVEGCTARVTIRLCFDPLGLSTSAMAPPVQQDAALAYYDVVDEVWKTLKGYSTENMGSLARLQQTTEKRDDGYKVVRQIWETNFSEDGNA